MRSALLGLVVGIGLVTPPTSPASPAPKQRTFATVALAAEALVAAAELFDVATFKEILGPEGGDLVTTGDPVLDRNQAMDFAKHARQKLAFVPHEKDPKVVTLTIGTEDWPLPFPLVERGSVWHFDTAAGRREILLRRIGRNELDAIEVCRGYLEAQLEYAAQPRGGSTIRQYAQRVIGTPEKEDGLAWRDADGTWRGPIGDKIARAIAQGYSSKLEPYHGYFFKILKGQGAHAPLGKLDFVVRGMMIGGFALVAAPAEYEVTGVKTFIVSHDGIVLEKDLGARTLEAFRAMERFDPDATWKPVKD